MLEPNKIRINMFTFRKDYDGPFKYPYWFVQAFHHVVQKYSEDYKVTKDQAFVYFTKEHSELIEPFRDFGFNVEGYDKTPLQSWGLIFDKNDPLLAEYILKYGDTKNE